MKRREDFLADVLCIFLSQFLIFHTVNPLEVKFLRFILPLKSCGDIFGLFLWLKRFDKNRKICPQEKSAKIVRKNCPQEKSSKIVRRKSPQEKSARKVKFFLKCFRLRLPYLLEIVKNFFQKFYFFDQVVGMNVFDVAF